MRNHLMFNSAFPLYDLELFYMNWTAKNKPSIDTLDDKIDFFNALMKYLEPKCTKYIQPEDGARAIEFFLDPCNRDEWDKAMNEIYDKEE